MALTRLPGFTVDSTSSFTFANASVTANVTAGNIKTDNLLYANGVAWTFGSTYGNSNVASYLPTYTGNITGNIVTLTGNVTAINANLGNLVTANYYSGTLTTSAQPNITSVGTLTSLTSGLITATSGGIKLGNIQDPTGTNTVSLLSGNVSMIGNLSVGTSGTGNVTATYFIGNGSQLTGLPATYANTNVASYLPTYTGNITGNIVTLTGNITSLNATLGNLVTANYFSGAGNLLSNIVGSNVTGQVANALIATTVTANAQPNITSVGTLISLTASGTISAGNLSTIGTLSASDATITGNLTVNGTTVTANVTTVNVKDPIIEMGGNTSGALISNDGKDRGTLLHYYTTTPVDAFMGWDNSNLEFAFGSNVTLSSEVATFNEFGNVRLGNIIGNGQSLTGLNASNLASGTISSGILGNSTVYVGTTSIALNRSTGAQSLTGITSIDGYASTVASNDQPNITSVGTLVSANVTGNISSGNANLGNLVTANYFTGNGSLLTGLPASYANANVEVYLPTYTGNLSPSNLVVSTSANLGAVGNVIITGGSANYVLTTDGAGSLSWSAASSSSSSITVDNFTGDGTTVDYTLSVEPANVNMVTVNYNGTVLLRESYSLVGNVLTLGSPPYSSSKVEVISITNLAGSGGGASDTSIRAQAMTMGIIFGG